MDSINIHITASKFSFLKLSERTSFVLPYNFNTTSNMDWMAHRVEEYQVLYIFNWVKMSNSFKYNLSIFIIILHMKQKICNKYKCKWWFKGQQSSIMTNDQFGEACLCIIGKVHLENAQLSTYINLNKLCKWREYAGITR